MMFHTAMEKVLFVVGIGEVVHGAIQLLRFVATSYSCDSSIFLNYWSPSLTAGQECGNHACTTVSVNIVFGTEPSITEKTKSCLSPVLWANN